MDKDKIFVSLEIEEEIAVKLRVLAAKLNISRSEYIRRIIDEHLAKNNK